jgi:hypothetical protein
LNGEVRADRLPHRLLMFAEPQFPEYVALSTKAQKTMSSQTASPVPELVAMPTREAGI